MKIHEYQGKEILRRFGVPTPRGIPAFSVDEAVQAAATLGGGVWVVKAQIHAGGRGKGGGVKLARSAADVRELAQAILGMQLVTHQTGAHGQKVRRLLIEQGADIRTELYLGMVVDRAAQRVVLMASSEGGMDIEAVAAKTPEKIHKVVIDPLQGLSATQADEVGRKIGVPEASLPEARDALQGLYRAFDQCDASLAEINPMIVTARAASWRSMPSSTSTTTRSFVTRTLSRCATSTRRIRPKSKRRSTTCPISRSTATLVVSSMAQAWRWRRWTRSSSTAACRRTSSMSVAAQPPRR